MCYSGYNDKKRKYFSVLEKITGLLLEGENLVDAAAAGNMTADEFKEALKTDIRKENFGAYLTITSEIVSDNALRILLCQEICSDKESRENCSYKVRTCLDFAKKKWGENKLQEFIESDVRFNNYVVYKTIAKEMGYKRLAP